MNLKCHFRLKLLEKGSNSNSYFTDGVKKKDVCHPFRCLFLVCLFCFFDFKLDMMILHDQTVHIGARLPE